MSVCVFVSTSQVNTSIRQFAQEFTCPAGVGLLSRDIPSSLGVGRSRMISKDDKGERGVLDESGSSTTLDFVDINRRSYLRSHAGLWGVSSYEACDMARG